MSRRYSSWRSLSSPNIRSRRTSENPMTALSGVRSSCDMLARNSDLCRLAISSWSVLTSSSRNSRALWMATADWLAGGSGRVAALPGDPREQRSPPVAPQLLGVDIQPLEIEVGGLNGLTADGGAAHQRVVDVDPQPPESLDERLARSDAGPYLERPGLRVELEDRSAVGPGEPHRLGDDRRQHLVEVAARADRVADLSQGPELVDRAREVLPALLERLEELDVLYRDRALRGEGVGQRDRLVVEWLDLVAPQGDDAEDALVDQHRHSQQGADAPELAGAVPLVVRVGDHVRDLDGAALQPDPADDGAGVPRDRPVLDPGAVRVRPAEQMGEAVHVAVEQVDHGRVGAAEPDHVAHDRLEHRLQLELRAPDDVEHLAGRRLLLDRVAQAPRELLDARVRCSGFLVGGHGSSRCGSPRVRTRWPTIPRAAPCGESSFSA